MPLSYLKNYDSFNLIIKICDDGSGGVVKICALMFVLFRKKW